LLAPLAFGRRHALGLLLYTGNGLVAEGILALCGERWRTKRLVRVGLLLLAAWTASWLVPDGTRAPGATRRVLLIQQSQRWSLARSEASRIRHHLASTERTLAADPRVDLVVWGESALGRLTVSGGRAVVPGAVRQAVSEWRVPLLAGATLSDGRANWNSLLAVELRGAEPCGRCRHDKAKLVPFAERWPRHWPWAPAPGRAFFAQGAPPSPVEVAGARWGATICFEGVDERAVRRLARGGADVLLNVSSDAWLNDEGARRAHRALSVLGSVEAGRELLRLASKGPTVHVRHGGSVEVVVASESGAGVAVVAMRSGATPFARFGAGGFALLFAVFVALAWALTPASRRR
jgi:apolipoprotein N-acyltransferase